MSSGHCSHCGAMSTIWLPTCVFCGNSLTDPGHKPRTRAVIQLALADQPATTAPSKVVKDQPRRCTSRIHREKPTFFEAIRAFFARLIVIRR
jgi:hypothetical protein